MLKQKAFALTLMTLFSPTHYPATPIQLVEENHFGTTVRDSYRWLEDARDPEVQNWMSEQDQFARGILAQNPRRPAIEARLKQLNYIDTIGAPLRKKNRFFYGKRAANQEKSVIYWRDGEKGEEHVLIDPNQLSSDGSVSLGTWVPTEDGKKVAYTLHPRNGDEAILYVMDVESGKTSDVDVIDGAKYASPNWTPDGSGFYYTYLPTAPSIPVADRPGFAEVRFHPVGSDPKKDPLVHPRTGNAATFIQPILSKDGRRLFIQVSHGWNSTDLFFRDLMSGSKEFKPFIQGVDARFDVTAFGGDFYIATNDGAPNSRVFKTSAAKLGRENWKLIVPEMKDASIEMMQIIGGKLVLTLLKNASSHIEVRDLDGTFIREIELPTIGQTSPLYGDLDQDEAYFTFESFTIAPQIYKTSISTGETSLWAKVDVPVDPSPYAVEQKWYKSKDGTPISIFVIHRKDAKRDGSTPFLLYGYGGFGLSMLPHFSATIYPWLEAGGGYAIANLRGGGEYGEDWHRAGMLAKKQNVFDDFNAAAEFLIAQGYASSSKLAIWGGSNGGLLVGAALTQRPELYRAAVCAVPLLDMVRYHLFGSGKTWIPEYGSADDEAQFKFLYAYSPYHHIQAGTAYPSMLFLSADNDDRVDPMHARKMAAALQAVNPKDRPVLLRIEKNAGHGGGGMVQKTVEQYADMFSFLFKELGIQ